MTTLLAASDLPPSYLYEYVGTKLITVASALIPLEIALVGLRYYSRYMHKTPVGLDDILVVPALILCLTLDVIGITITKYGGVGRHLLALEVTDPTKIVIWAKHLIAAEWIYLAAVTFPKLSILGIYLRIFTTKPYRATVYVVAVIIILTFVAGGLTGSLGCQPLAFFWDHNIPGGHCININAFFRWISLPNIITDVVMLVLPLPVVWGLNTTRNQKIGLTVTFLTGSVGLLASIFRFKNFFQNDAITDGTFSSAELMAWTIIEPGAYLIAACLPILRPLIQQVFKSTCCSSLGRKRTRNYGSVSGKRNTADFKLMGHKGLKSKVDQSPSGFQRLANSKYSFGKGIVLDYECGIENAEEKSGSNAPSH